MSLRADEVHKPVGKPSAERSTSKEEGADKDRKTAYRKPHSEKQRGREAERQRGREAFTEGPIKAIAEFTTVGRSHMQETRVTSTREGK